MVADTRSSSELIKQVSVRSEGELHCSANELTAALRKAALACGITLASAEEFARAVCVLLPHDKRAVTMALDAFVDAASVTADQNFRHHSGSLDLPREFASVKVALQGPSVLDTAVATAILHRSKHIEANHIELGSVDFPDLLVTMAFVRLYDTGQAFRFEFTDGLCLSIDGESSCIMDIVRQCSAVWPESSVHERVALGAVAMPQNRADTVSVGIDTSALLTVNLDHWEAIGRLAAQTYVPSSETSRIAGAGAGLTDND